MTTITEEKEQDKDVESKKAASSVESDSEPAKKKARLEKNDPTSDKLSSTSSPAVQIKKGKNRRKNLKMKKKKKLQKLQASRDKPQNKSEKPDYGSKEHEAGQSRKPQSQPEKVQSKKSSFQKKDGPGKTVRKPKRKKFPTAD
ncbi:hypothetical protein MRX96_000663 [Rhipicephalus microplus]